MAYHLSLRRLLALSALCSLGSAHSKIQKASCDGGKTSSIGMGTNPNIPIDGEDPTPFQLDSPIIRTKEKDNLLVNGCGRTKLQTNIDVANETEIAIQNNQIANCKPGDTLSMTVFVVNTDGSGPYFADIDEKSNVGIFRELGKVDGIDGKNGIQRNAFTAFDVQIPLPTDMKCEGGKDLNACTLRIRNLADAGPFGGCVALQDVTKGGAGNGGTGNGGAGNGGAGNGGAGNGGVGNGGNGGNGGLGNGDQGNNDLGDGGLGGNGGQGNKGQGNKGQGKQQISLKSLEDFLKNGGKNKGGNPQNGQNNAGNGQTGGNQTGGTQTGGTQTGGNQIDGNQIDGNQKGGNQKGGNRKGGNQNGVN
ncbi:hypothetical protein VCV18_008080 [Metarhizium anisopliae]